MGFYCILHPGNNHVQYICDVKSYKRLGYNNVLFKYFTCIVHKIYIVESNSVFLKIYFKNPAQFAKVSLTIHCTCMYPFLLILKTIET